MMACSLLFPLFPLKGLFDSDSSFNSWDDTQQFLETAFLNASIPSIIITGDDLISFKNIIENSSNILGHSFPVNVTLQNF